jgi:hypothetical protein
MSDVQPPRATKTDWADDDSSSDDERAFTEKLGAVPQSASSRSLKHDEDGDEAGE